jgi:SAM-dependent methyltransferase
LRTSFGFLECLSRMASSSTGCSRVVTLGKQASDKVYTNVGNIALVDMISPEANWILDIGCGSGANARLLKQKGVKGSVFGVTLSEREREEACRHMERCWVADIETLDTSYLSGLRFECMLFCHVLEHLRDPVSVIRSFLPFLELGGCILIAVPNILFWRHRLRFLAGRFEHEEGGIMDDGHLRFFTYRTAHRYLVEPLGENVQMVDRVVTGAVPLWMLRRYVLPRRWSAKIDRSGCKLLPNLFGDQILLKCIRKI